MRRKDKHEQPSTSGTSRITPVDIQQAEFRLAFRGYNERDVDAFLDRVTEDLSAYLEEIQRLQTTPGAAVAGAHDDEAADIVARARAEAAAIVRAAEDEAAAIRASAGGATGGDARSAVAPFLNKEREFLQGLGTLVQTHAEEIKAMVLAIRARAEAAQPETNAVRADEDVPSEASNVMPSESEASNLSPPTSQGATATFEPASSSEIRTRLGSETVSVSDEQAADDEETVIVESATEPVFTTEGSPATDRRERSLRELFWGEE
jgi:DivIVA domain-containing protein